VEVLFPRDASSSIDSLRCVVLTKTVAIKKTTRDYHPRLSVRLDRYQTHALS
jgi:hypothetical protein